ncbi:MAG: BTAD domain-containing putative transcriptional regulator [Acidimicrobiia bacterium]
MRVDALVFASETKRFLEDPSIDPGWVPVELYGDDLLIDFYDDWVLLERDRLGTLYMDALLQLAQLMRTRSEYETAIRYASLALDHDRANEKAHQHLMFCHLALGNRTGALRQFDACRTAMLDELGVEPSETTERLHSWIRRAPSERSPMEGSITNLPIPSTRFVGREQEMSDVIASLRSNRMVTLTGAGGVGKTRLAIHVGSHLLEEFEDGVWWIELGSLANPDLLPATVAKALGVPESADQSSVEHVSAFVGSRRLLLILDNCEHLIESCAEFVVQILGRAQNLTILATSRESLSIDGEQVRPVRGLSLPEPDRTERWEDLNDYESTRLFLNRARSFDPNFTLNEKRVRAVARICYLLGGSPLAIELAAARVGSLTPEQIAERLEHAFDVLDLPRRGYPARHQTLSAAIGWSHDLLADDERILFRRLSVFAGGFTLGAAEAVCSDADLAPESIACVLIQLVDKSLVDAQTRGGEKRYRLLETIRRYSSDRVAETDEGQWLLDHHLQYFRQEVEGVHAHVGYFLSDAQADIWVPRIDADIENLRAAVATSLARGASPSSRANGLVLAANLHWLWVARGRFDEGRAWLARLLEASERVASETRSLGLLTAGYLACWQGDFVSGRPLLQQAAALCEELQDGHGVAFAISGLGFAAVGEGELHLSKSYLEKSLERAREIEDIWLESFSEHWLGVVLEYMGEYSQAYSLLESGEAHVMEMGGHRQALAFSLLHQARIARLLGDYPSARLRQIEGMRLFKEAGDLRGLGYSFTGLAVLAASEGEPARAATLSGAVASIQDEVGSLLELPLQIEYDKHLAAVQGELGQTTFSEAQAEGAAMTLSRTIDYALPDSLTSL